MTTIDGGQDPVPPSGDIMGWRNIARHLGISQKTARNWELERGLPVHRFEEGEKSPVWANADELREWKRKSASQVESPRDGVIETKNRRPLSSVAPAVALRLTRPFGGHAAHIVLASTLYALLYVASMLLEITYQFDRLGETALKIAPLLFIWILSTSLLGLRIQWEMVLRQKGSGLALSMAVFVTAALVQHAALTLFLPATPVTAASFQTLPAQAAHLKNTISFLELPALFIVPPYHFILAVRAAMARGGHELVLVSIKNSKWYYSKRLTADALYIRREWLGLGILVAAGLFIASSWHVFDRLKPSPYLNAFVHLFLLRDCVWFILSVECLFWYNQHINQVVQECEEALSSDPRPVLE